MTRLLPTAEAGATAVAPVYRMPVAAAWNHVASVDCPRRIAARYPDLRIEFNTALYRGFARQKA
jgi:hypothetical protein